jgi:hypothetical protein
MKKIILSIALATLALSGCSKMESKGTNTLTSKSNLVPWSTMLNPKEASKDSLLLTTPKPSNVSANMALTKMLQALNSYDGDSTYHINTVFTINRTNEVIIRGKKWYVGACEFDQSKSNGADISELGGISPCIALVDAENKDAPAILRTANAQGKPYRLKLHLESHLSGKMDKHHIRKFLHQNGFKNYNTLDYEISKPNIELDSDYNVYYSASWLKDDGVGAYGTAYYPLAFVLVNLQTTEIQAFSMDNPLTKEVNEGMELLENTQDTFDKIPTWVDWVYSKRLLTQMATHYGYDINGYGKHSYKNWLILDGSKVNDDIEIKTGYEPTVDSSKSKNGKDIILTAYFTSRSNDLAVNQILQFNARTGEAVLFDRKGSLYGMTVKSAIVEMMQNSALMVGHYDIEDMTLNPIFNTLTWQGVITRNLHDNEGNDKTKTGDTPTFYSEKDVSYSVYAQTCLIEASNNISIADMICHKDTETAYTLYRDHLYKTKSRSQISTVLIDSEIKSTITKRYQLDNTIIFKVDNSDKTFIVTVDNIYDKNLGDAISLDKGDKVYIKYGDQKNINKVPVRYISQL